MLQQQNAMLHSLTSIVPQQNMAGLSTPLLNTLDKHYPWSKYQSITSQYNVSLGLPIVYDS